VFVASITVPLVKLVGMTTMLLLTHDRSATWLVPRTRIFRAIDAVGRWSMIDVFMLTTLVALVHRQRTCRCTPAGWISQDGGQRAGLLVTAQALHRRVRPGRTGLP